MLVEEHESFRDDGRAMARKLTIPDDVNQTGGGETVAFLPAGRYDEDDLTPANRQQLPEALER